MNIVHFYFVSKFKIVGINLVLHYECTPGRNTFHFEALWLDMGKYALTSIELK